MYNLPQTTYIFIYVFAICLLIFLPNFENLQLFSQFSQKPQNNPKNTGDLRKRYAHNKPRPLFLLNFWCFCKSGIGLLNFLRGPRLPRPGGTPRAGGRRRAGSAAISDATFRCHLGPLAVPLLLPPRWEPALGCRPSQASTRLPLECQRSASSGRASRYRTRATKVRPREQRCQANRVYIEV